jgi:hypothetical protein
MLLTIIFPGIAAFGVIATIALNLITLRIGWQNQALARQNKEHIQLLNVNVDGKLEQLIESISAERFGAGMQQERIDSRARQAASIADVAGAVATVADAAKVAAASVIATAVEVAKGA